MRACPRCLRTKQGVLQAPPVQAWCGAALWQALMGDPFAQSCLACMLTTEPAAHKHLRVYLNATMLMWGDGHAGGRSRRGSACGGRGRSSGAPRAAQRRDGPAAEGAVPPQHAGCCGHPRVEVPSRHACHQLGSRLRARAAARGAPGCSRDSANAAPACQPQGCACRADARTRRRRLAHTTLP